VSAICQKNGLPTELLRGEEGGTEEEVSFACLLFEKPPGENKYFFEEQK